MSNGDNAGVVGGVMSGMIMGPSRHLMGATNVLIGGNPATKMTDPTGQNGSSQNVPGSTIAPAQTKVMIMSGGSGGGGGASSSQNVKNSTQESKNEDKVSVKNPRWEHVDEQAKEESPDITLEGDTVMLKADISNVRNGTTVTFKIFDSATAKRVGMVLGEVTDGVASAEWRVQAPLSSDGNKPSVGFEALVRGISSKTVDIPVGGAFHFSL